MTVVSDSSPLIALAKIDLNQQLDVGLSFNSLIIMIRKISALTARTQLGQIMNRPVETTTAFSWSGTGNPPS